jgi:hypothetical protein
MKNTSAIKPVLIILLIHLFPEKLGIDSHYDRTEAHQDGTKGRASYYPCSWALSFTY